MSYIGEPLRTIISEPQTEPVPSREPVHTPESEPEPVMPADVPQAPEVPVEV